MNLLLTSYGFSEFGSSHNNHLGPFHNRAHSFMLYCDKHELDLFWSAQDSKKTSGENSNKLVK